MTRTQLTDESRRRSIARWLSETRYTTLEATTFASTIAAPWITLVMLQSPAISEANPVADWLIHSAGPLAAAGLAAIVAALQLDDREQTDDGLTEATDRDVRRSLQALEGGSA